MYRLSKDPGETVDLWAGEAVAGWALDQLLGWRLHKDALSITPETRKETENRRMDPSLRDRLRGLGYLK